MAEVAAPRNQEQGSGIRDQRSGIRDQGSGIRDQGSGIRDQASVIKNPVVEDRGHPCQIRGLLILDL
jgi:hypothetical protein